MSYSTKCLLDEISFRPNGFRRNVMDPFCIPNKVKHMFFMDPNLNRMPQAVLLIIKILIFANFDLKSLIFWCQNACDSLAAKVVSKCFIHQF